MRGPNRRLAGGFRHIRQRLAQPAEFPLDASSGVDDLRQKAACQVALHVGGGGTRLGRGGARLGGGGARLGGGGARLVRGGARLGECGGRLGGGARPVGRCAAALSKGARHVVNGAARFGQLPPGGVLGCAAEVRPVLVPDTELLAPDPPHPDLVSRQHGHIGRPRRLSIGRLRRLSIGRLRRLSIGRLRRLSIGRPRRLGIGWLPGFARCPGLSFSVHLRDALAAGQAQGSAQENDHGDPEGDEQGDHAPQTTTASGPRRCEPAARPCSGSAGRRDVTWTTARPAGPPPPSACC